MWLSVSGEMGMGTGPQPPVRVGAAWGQVLSRVRLLFEAPTEGLSNLDCLKLFQFENKLFSQRCSVSV